MNKSQILEAMKSTTAENNGKPLGMDKFFEKTGITRNDWRGKYWAKWSDAIKEAGFSPNKFSNPAFETDWMIKQLLNIYVS